MEPVFSGQLVEVDGVLTLPATGRELTADDVRTMRLAEQR
jgi:hypothetical protein